MRAVSPSGRNHGGLRRALIAGLGLVAAANHGVQADEKPNPSTKDIVELCASPYFPESVKRGDALGWSRVGDDYLEATRASLMAFALNNPTDRPAPPALSGKPTDVVNVMGWQKTASPLDGRVFIARSFGFSQSRSCYAELKGDAPLENDLTAQLGAPQHDKTYNAGHSMFWRKDKTTVFLVHYMLNDTPITYMLMTTQAE